MFLTLIGLAVLIGGITFWAIDKIKKNVEGKTDKLSVFIQKVLLGGWKTEVLTLVVGTICGLVCKLLIVAGGVEFLLQHGYDFTDFVGITWWGFALAGAVSGFAAAIAVKFKKIPKTADPQ